MVGLGRALRHLAIRGMIVFVVWTAIMWFITPGLNFMVPDWSFFGLTAVVMAAAGTAIACVLAKNLTVVAGMSGLPVALMAIAFGWAVAVLSVLVADSVRPLGDWQYGFAVVGTGCGCSLWLLKATLLDA